MDTTMVGQVMEPPHETVAAAESVETVRRRLTAETLRALAVAAGGRLVGVVCWDDLERIAPADHARLTAADVMRREVPPVHPDTTLGAALALVPDVNLDPVPVTDATGRLVGEVPRAALVVAGPRLAAADAPEATPEPDEAGRVLNIVAGMHVVGRGGDRIGTVDGVVEDSEGRITHLDVKHGLLHHTTRLPIGLVARVADDTVVLEADHDDIDRLPHL